jgi:hypothetical protein
VRLRRDARRGIAYIEHAKVLVAVARRRGRDETAIGHGVGDAVDDARMTEHVIGARGARRRLGMRKLLRLHEYELPQSHVLHGARDRADVAGM